MHESVKQGFLQACINFGCLTLESVLMILTPLCEAYDVDAPCDQDGLRNFVKEIDREISQFNQTLTFIRHPLVDEHFLVFGYTSESQVGKLQSHYTAEDRYYFYKIIDAMVDGTDYGITWSAVYNVGIPPNVQKPITKNHMQELVQNWTHQGYFIEKDNSIYFGPRMLVEYSSHLKTNYPDFVKDCPLCSKLVLWDVSCSECDTKIHRECIKKYLIKKSTCPSCQKTWSTSLARAPSFAHISENTS